MHASVGMSRSGSRPVPIISERRSEDDLRGPRQLPIDGEPADVTAIVTTYGEWLAHSDVPKLYIQGDPGRAQPSQQAFCRTWPAQSEVIVPGLHNLQEDSPDQIGQALASWLRNLKEAA